MTATNATNALRAVIERLRDEADGGLLQGCGVGYEFSSDLGDRAVYAGGDDFEQASAIAEDQGTLQYESVQITLYIQVMIQPPVSRIETDTECSKIADVVARIFIEQPDLAGDMTWIGIASGRGDYEQTDTATRSWRLLRMKIQSHLSWRQ